MTKRNILVLCGRAGAGKDAFADSFCAAGYECMKFARPLKDAILCLFPHMDERHVDGELKDSVDPVTGATPRALMQFIGTDLLQHGLKARFPGVGRGIFASALARRAELLAGRDLVMTDLRFPHELEAVRRLKGSASRVLVVKIVRSPDEGSDSATEHESERPIPSGDCDIVIHNNGTLADLHESARELLAFVTHRSRVR